MEFRFKMPVNVIMGVNCVADNAALIAGFGKKALVVTDGVAAEKNGSLKDVLGALAQVGVEHDLFDKIASNPSVESVREGAKMAKAIGAEMVIAIGGGSSMDAGKAIALLACQGELTDQQLLDGDFVQKKLPLITVPTTSGTGSEVTPFAMLTSEQLGKKINLHSGITYSDVAFLDQRYTATAPRTVTVNTAIDAISHAVEAIITVPCNPVIKLMAIEALECAGKCLPKLRDNTMDDEARGLMMYACTLAGMAEGQTRTSGLHALTYPMTFYRHVPHGRAVGLIFAPYLRFTEKGNPALVKCIWDALGVSGADEFAGYMDALLGEKDVFSEEEIDLYASEAAASRNIKNSLVPPAKADLAEMLRF